MVFHKHVDGGAFGDVWLGITIKAGIACAVKVIQRTGRASIEEEGQREYNWLERLKTRGRHPHVVEGLGLILSPQTGTAATLDRQTHNSESFCL